ncbi:hypothetical protein I5S53_12015 [Pseudomonas juntendi]|uniref:DUF6957 family protein n=1 Tax=Pseudomonas juntendi TaxID=2666183 RepID=UPI0018D85986|nr:hypothetical protein [Pseudomonas juntendi]MBH3384686.1 hypothetical protein [Pseudomonas juntendi]MDG9917849.1 hypothetical protein [Pseudomonas juntendi]MDH0506314.1 hypothetical protein [Pseudomonas juntendi]MDH1044564.1 hypothetical protein [Pseudomonas juntendi]
MRDFEPEFSPDLEGDKESICRRWCEKSILIDGSGMSMGEAEHIFDRSVEIYGKQAIIVSDWFLFYVNSPPEQASPKYDDLKPFVICSLNVVKDAKNSQSSVVRTSQVLLFFEKSIFVTRNTVYLLVGPGRLMNYRAAPEAFTIFFSLLGLRL